MQAQDTTWEDSGCIYSYTGELVPEDDVYYKVADSEGYCYDVQYKVGEVYAMPEEKLELCHVGYHACKHPIQCASFIEFLDNSKYFAVKLLGKVVREEDENLSPKVATNIMKIIKEIPFQDWMKLCTVTICEYYHPDRKYYVRGMNCRLSTKRIWIYGRLQSQTFYWDNGNVKIVRSRFWCGGGYSRWNIISFYRDGDLIYEMNGYKVKSRIVTAFFATSSTLPTLSTLSTMLNFFYSFFFVLETTN
jgi:hypothetical protein